MPKGYGMGKGRKGGDGGGGGSYSQGMTNGSSVINGTGKSSAMSASKNESGGNYGKPIGDRGMSSKKGNRRTYQVADRYK